MKHSPTKYKYRDDLENRRKLVSKKIKVLTDIVYADRPIDDSFFKDSKTLNNLKIELKTINSRLNHLTKGSDFVDPTAYFPAPPSNNINNQY